MIKLVDFKTYIPEKSVWVSTVAYDEEIAPDSYAETMVFKGNRDGITDWSELYYKSHGYIIDREELRRRHEEIVWAIRNGAIKLHDFLDKS